MRQYNPVSALPAHWACRRAPHNRWIAMNKRDRASPAPKHRYTGTRDSCALHNCHSAVREGMKTGRSNRVPALGEWKVCLGAYQLERRQPCSRGKIAMMTCGKASASIADFDYRPSKARLRPRSTSKQNEQTCIHTQVTSIRARHGHYSCSRVGATHRQ